MHHSPLFFLFMPKIENLKNSRLKNTLFGFNSLIRIKWFQRVFLVQDPLFLLLNDYTGIILKTNIFLTFHLKTNPDTYDQFNIILKKVPGIFYMQFRETAGILDTYHLPKMEKTNKQNICSWFPFHFIEEGSSKHDFSPCLS